MNELIEYRITFGQRYSAEPHPAFKAAHPEGYLAVMAPDELTARRMAIATITNAWACIYGPESYPDPKYVPRGELGRIWVMPEPAPPGTVPDIGVVEFLLRHAGSDEQQAHLLKHHFDCPVPHCAENHDEDDDCSCECSCGVAQIAVRMLAESSIKRTLVQWARALNHRDKATHQTAAARAETVALEKVLLVISGVYPDATRFDPA